MTLRHQDDIDGMIEAARQAGYDVGYVDGRNATLEELLAWRPPGFTVDRAADQLGQQVKIREAG